LAADDGFRYRSFNDRDRRARVSARGRNPQHDARVVVAAKEFTVAWPTGEIGGMGLEGAVRLGFSKELAAVADPIERQNLLDKLVEAAYQHGKALTSATTFELDDVIDPADSRAWITRLSR
jgi:acetyl-CoA carboxylase carboxyltransferase component